jgi:hypothetical protein
MEKVLNGMEGALGVTRRRARHSVHTEKDMAVDDLGESW